MSTKYVVIDELLGEVMYIFPSWVQHADFINSMGGISGMLGDPNVVSAGFLIIDTNSDGKIEVQAFGKSISLDVDAREEEDTILAAQTLELGSYGWGL